MYSRNESLATPPATAPIKEWEPACQHEQLTGSRVDEELEVWGGVLHLDAVGHEQVSSQVSLLLVSSCLLFLNKTYCHSTCAFIGTGKNESLFPENQTKKKKKKVQRQRENGRAMKCKSWDGKVQDSSDRKFSRSNFSSLQTKSKRSANAGPLWDFARENAPPAVLVFES